MPPAERASFVLRRYLRVRLQQREQENLLRRHLTRTGLCQPATDFIDGARLSFCSNDYLGLASHPVVIKALKSAADKYGVGSGASHLVTGHTRAHAQLAEELADFLGRDRVLLFSTGYMANMGVINALTRPGAPVFQDALNHASLLDGGWLGRGTVHRYAHADVEDLAHQLAAISPADAAQSLLITDGVFSMDGDVAPLPDLVSLADRHSATLIVDDAHGVGCAGPGGGGVLDAFGLNQDDVPVLTATFGKALGTAGACVAGSHDLIEYLEQFARTYIFTTAMPPALADATRASLALLRDEPWRRERLQTLIARFRAGVAGMQLGLLPSHTPVQALVLGDAGRALEASAMLAHAGLQVSAIRPPSVPAGQARLRVTLSATHQDDDLERLLSALHDVSVRLKSYTNGANSDS